MSVRLVVVSGAETTIGGSATGTVTLAGNGDAGAARISDGGPNCSTIPLTCVLNPLHEAAGLHAVRVSTYQAVSGAGAQRMEQLRVEPRRLGAGRP